MWCLRDASSGRVGGCRGREPTLSVVILRSNRGALGASLSPPTLSSDTPDSTVLAHPELDKSSDLFLFSKRTEDWGIWVSDFVKQLTHRGNIHLWPVGKQPTDQTSGSSKRLESSRPLEMEGGRQPLLEPLTSRSQPHPLAGPALLCFFSKGRQESYTIHPAGLQLVSRAGGTCPRHVCLPGMRKGK